VNIKFLFSEEILLENEFVRLEPLKMSHLDFLVLIAEQTPDLLKFSPSPFGDRAALQDYIQIALDEKSNLNRYPFVIFDKQKEKYAGSTSFADISAKNQRLEIGWTWIGKDFQGTGLNKNCKFLMLRYAFEILAFERVEFKADSRNLQSRRAIEKIGATYEGELRSHTLMNDGYRRHTVYYSILKDEWQAVKQNILL
jgi:RimJ/RimL family protein N-acetyltransferase